MITDAGSGINNLLKKYSAIDFGIGLDYGDILCTKVGVGGDSNNKDLFWVGNSVNKSVRLSDKAEVPNRIYISKIVYDNLEDRVKYTTKKNIWGIDEKIDMWTKSSLKYNDAFENCYYTNYWMYV